MHVLACLCYASDTPYSTIAMECILHDICMRCLFVNAFTLHIATTYLWWWNVYYTIIYVLLALWMLFILHTLIVMECILHDIRMYHFVNAFHTPCLVLNGMCIRLSTMFIACHIMCLHAVQSVFHVFLVMTVSLSCQLLYTVNTTPYMLILGIVFSSTLLPSLACVSCHLVQQFPQFLHCHFWSRSLILWYDWLFVEKQPVKLSFSIISIARTLVLVLNYHLHFSEVFHYVIHWLPKAE